MASVVAPSVMMRARFGLCAVRTEPAARATPRMTKAHDPESTRAAFMSTSTAKTVPVTAIATLATLPYELVAQSCWCSVEAIIPVGIGNDGSGSRGRQTHFGG